MYYLFRKLKHYYNSRTFHLFIISFFIYAILNMVENYIHYNIGKHQESNYNIKFSNPSALDWMKIIIVMFVFALLQGILTILVDEKWNKNKN
jgi:hypothetical protein